MPYYTVLTIATVIIGLLALVTWRRTGSVAFPIGIALLYYWTLLGAWFIVIDLLGGNSGMRYHSYFYQVTPIRLDSDYLWTLVLYGIFIIVIELAVLHFVRAPGFDEPTIPPIRISHAKILALASVTGLVAYLLVRNSLANAAAGNHSGYAYVRYDTSTYFTIHLLLDGLASLGLCLGCAVLSSGKRARYIVGQGASAFVVLGYLVVLGSLFHLNLLMGDRHELVTGLMSAVLFYLANDRRPKKTLLGLSCFVALVGIGFVGLTRGYAGENVFLGSDPATLIKNALGDNLLSNEPFEAHMSLYGVIHKNVPLTYGSSLVALAASIVPRAFWPTRPGDIYAYYAQAVGASSAAGYTVHHATGWYLNFGVPGIIAGAIFLGWLWATLFNKFHSDLRAKSHFHRLFCILTFVTFTASIPTISRAGIEAYKTVAFEVLILPTLFVFVASLRVVLRANRPALGLIEARPNWRARVVSSPISNG